VCAVVAALVSSPAWAALPSTAIEIEPSDVIFAVRRCGPDGHYYANCAATDEAHWRSFWHQPPEKPAGDGERRIVRSGQ